VYSFIGLIEQISITMLDAAGGGAASLAAIPQANPVGLFKGIAAGATAGVTAPYYATKAAIYASKNGKDAGRVVRAAVVAMTAPISVPLAVAAKGAKGAGRAWSKATDRLVPEGWQKSHDTLGALARVARVDKAQKAVQS